jgi:glycosyltransferase involved in cell wall biosynthesis
VTRRLAFLVPGDPDARTGGYGYDRRIADGLRAGGWQLDTVRLSDTFPFPTAAALDDADAALAREPDDALVLVDGLAYGAMPGAAARHAMRLRLVALVHHPLALETGLTEAQAAALARDERAALAVARHVVVTSPGTAATLGDWDVPPSRLSVVEPGTDPAPVASGHTGEHVHLLSIGALTPRKGVDLLVEALAPLADRPWRLTCVGSLTRDPGTAARVRDRVAHLGLAERVDLVGELDADGVTRAYDGADAFVLASRYEGYGMVVAEALARGLPVVATDTGASADLVGHDAGLVVPPGDVGALRVALTRLLDDAALREAFAAGARARRATLPGWETACARMASVLTQVAHA